MGQNRSDERGVSGKNRKDIKPGLRVYSMQKPYQRSGRLAGGTVKDVLAKSAYRQHGIKIRPETGELGRVPEMAETSRDAEAAERSRGEW